MKPDRPSMYFDEPAVLARLAKPARSARSEHALGDHGVGDLDEAGGVGAEHQIALMAVLLGGGQGIGDDVLHDGLELVVHLFERPGKAVGVLAAARCRTARSTRPCSPRGIRHPEHARRIP